jgi:cellulose synthase/poly-beta-1,6-N-acetylglucosamine synthase-like glycosyltransferase
MLFLFIILPFLFLFIYSCLIIGYFLAWKITPSYKVGIINGNKYLSVIIAARNEEQNIQNLLNDLVLQSYDKNFFEIIVINDHSEDNTPDIIKEFKNYSKNLVSIDLPENRIGKKNAINTGISLSKGELIITVDADCRIGKYWLSEIASFYNEFKPRLIIGPLLYHNEKSILEQFQSIEILSLVASGAGAALMGKPILCNGANLAFTRETYLEVYPDLKMNVASGDDVFMLLEVKKRWPESIRFIKSTNALALTNPEPYYKKFLMQKKRWISKAIYYRNPDIIMVSVLVFILNLSIVIALFLSLFSLKAFLVFVSLMIIKSIPDYLLLNSFAKYFDKSSIMRYFWIAQFLYPFYAVIISLTGNFGKFEWKNRKYKI